MKASAERAPNQLGQPLIRLRATLRAAAALFSAAALPALFSACGDDPVNEQYFCVFENRTVRRNPCPRACAYQCGVNGATTCFGEDCVEHCSSRLEAQPQACQDQQYRYWRCVWGSGRGAFECADGGTATLSADVTACVEQARAVSRACPATPSDAATLPSHDGGGPARAQPLIDASLP